MAISQNFPDVRPSLNLNFARSKTLDPRITFERASIGTYVDENGLIKTAAADEARFDHNPETGESLGLLIEEQRTNIWQYSSDLNISDNPLYGNWVKSTVISNTSISPDGTLTADTISPQAPSSSIIERFTATAGTTYTFSIYLKRNPESNDSVLDYFKFFVSWSNNGSTYTGVSLYALVSGFSTTDVLTNEWKRFSFSYTCPAGAVSMEMGVTNGNSGVGDPPYSVLAWGAQIEAGSFPTSYIPTSGSTVTRQAERANITGTNFSDWYNQDEGTIFLESNTSRNSNLILSSKYIWGLNDGSSANYIGYSSNRYQTSGGQVSLSHNIESTFKSASSYKKDDFAVSDKGSPVLTDTSAILPTGIDRLTIGDLEPVGNRRINTTISKLLYYPERLTNAQLQNLTK